MQDRPTLHPASRQLPYTEAVPSPLDVVIGVLHRAEIVSDPHHRKDDPMTASTPVAADQKNSVIAVYPDHDTALQALKTLQDAGYDDQHVSIVGKGVKETKEIHGWVPQGSEAGHFGAWGAFWGALSGWLLLGFVWLPGIGWVAAGGWLAATLLGAGIGAGLGALTGLGVPQEEIPQYEDELKADRYLVVVHGDTASVARAEGLLSGSGSGRVRTYSGS
jgi:hypothetical protein